MILLFRISAAPFIIIIYNNHRVNYTSGLFYSKASLFVQLLFLLAALLLHDDLRTQQLFLLLSFSVGEYPTIDLTSICSRLYKQYTAG